MLYDEFQLIDSMHQPVLVRWLDAQFNLEPTAEQLADWIETGGVVAESLGWVYHNDERSLILYAERFPHSPEIDHRGFTQIPSQFILDIKLLAPETIYLEPQPEE